VELLSKAEILNLSHERFHFARGPDFYSNECRHKTLNVFKHFISKRNQNRISIRIFSCIEVCGTTALGYFLIHATAYLNETSYGHTQHRH